MALLFLRRDQNAQTCADLALEVWALDQARRFEAIALVFWDLAVDEPELECDHRVQLTGEFLVHVCVVCAAQSKR